MEQGEPGPSPARPRVVVIGGRGHLGSHAVTALQRAPAVEVVVASRKGPVAIDLADPRTFAALDGADVVVDASSSHAVRPDALASYCLEHGLTMLEASSDRQVVERLLSTHRGVAARGTLALGGGIFTGVSNALGAHAATRVRAVRSLEIGVRSSPFSGAGGGTVDLMADVLAIPTRSVKDGAPVDGPSVAAGPRLPFFDGEHATLHVPFAEPAMLHASTGARDVAMYMAPSPSLLRIAFLALPLWLASSRAFGAFLRLYFSFLRRVVLRRASSRVGLVARATGEDGEHVAVVDVDDGFAAAGAAIAATAIALAGQREPRRGTWLVDELVPLDVMLDGITRLSDVRVRTRGVS